MSEQIEFEAASAGFQGDDLRQIRRVLAGFRFLRQRAVTLGEAPVPLRPFARALEQLVNQFGRTQSPLERQFLALLTAHGLAWQFEVQGRIPITVVQADGSVKPITTSPDFIARQCRLAVYVDGLAYHGSPEAIVRDAEINYALSLNGWRVLRIHACSLRDRPAQVLAMVRRGLAAAGASATEHGR